MTGPHDRFFRYIFSPPARAEALLRHNIPVPLTAAVDWSSLRRESGTLVDWDRETRKDLLFSARYLHSAEDAPPHFFLIEHQSSVDRWMALRMLDYSWRLIQHWREVNPYSPWIPAVTPLVVYPRQGRSWSAPRKLEEHYRVPSWAAGTRRQRRWALRSEYRVDDLSAQSERAVLARSGPALVPLGLLVLRFADTEQLAQRLPHWRELFSRVYVSAHGPQALYRVVRYLHQLGDARVHAAAKRVLHSIMESKKAEAFMKTMAEVLKDQGRQMGLVEGEARGLAKGLAEGEAKGLAKAVLRLLEAKGVRVDDASRQRIQNCTDVATLERWLERAVGATRLSEVLDGSVQ
jgi:predicted transposase YdaD